MAGTLFLKSSCRSLDSKGRLMLPPEYREAIMASSGEQADGGLFVLTGFYGRLVGYTKPHWEENLAQFAQIKMPSMNLDRFISKVVGLAEEIVLDPQGRIRIPKPLMREAGLAKDVQLVGLISRFQIWDQATYENIQLNDISEELASTGVNISL